MPRSLESSRPMIVGFPALQPVWFWTAPLCSLFLSSIGVLFYLYPFVCSLREIPVGFRLTPLFPRTHLLLAPKRLLSSKSRTASVGWRTAGWWVNDSYLVNRKARWSRSWPWVLSWRGRWGGEWTSKMLLLGHEQSLVKQLKGEGAWRRR